MNTAIIYASKHGATAEIAGRIASQIGGTATLFDLADGKPDLTDFQTVVLGTAIYAGQPMSTMKKYAQTIDPAGKMLGLFACGMETDDSKRAEEIAAAFPERLQRQAVVSAFMPGRYQFAKMNVPERFIIKRIAKTNRDVDAIDDNAIVTFAASLPGSPGTRTRDTDPAETRP